MTPTRRLTAVVLAAAFVPALGGCGDAGFGDFLRGSGSAGTPTPSASVPASQGATGTQSPEPAWASTLESDSPLPTEVSGSPTDLASTDDAAPSTSPASPPTTTAAPMPAASPSAPRPATPQGAVVQVDGRTITGVPVGLAFPEGAEVEGTNAFEGGGGSVVLSAPAEKAVFGYYRSALPGAGYRVVSDTAGLLAFTGHGYRGTIVGTGRGAVLTWSPAAS